MRTTYLIFFLFNYGAQSFNPLFPISNKNCLFAATVDVSSIPVKSKKIKKSLDVRIDDIWYDLSGWRNTHPAGDHWIDLYRDRDATEVIHGFHSSRGMEMLNRLPKSSNVDELEQQAAPVSDVTRNFRALRKRLAEEGWWNRDYLHEARLFSIWMALFGSGVAVAHSLPWVSIVLLGLANTAAGWIGHDYIHGNY